MKTRLSKRWSILFFLYPWSVFFWWIHMICLLLVNTYSSYFTACFCHQQSFDFFLIVLGWLFVHSFFVFLVVAIFNRELSRCIPLNKGFGQFGAFFIFIFTRIGWLAHWSTVRWQGLGSWSRDWLRDFSTSSESALCRLVSAVSPPWACTHWDGCARSKLPRPCARSKLPRPCARSKLPRPCARSKLPRPCARSKLPRPSYSKRNPNSRC